GEHTLGIRVTGTKNVSSSSDKILSMPGNLFLTT
ncbi:unnamed protein product, partial [marine sediment metagenome]